LILLPLFHQTLHLRPPMHSTFSTTDSFAPTLGFALARAALDGEGITLGLRRFFPFEPTKTHPRPLSPCPSLHPCSTWTRSGYWRQLPGQGYSLAFPMPSLCNGLAQRQSSHRPAFEQTKLFPPLEAIAPTVALTYSLTHQPTPLPHIHASPMHTVVRICRSTSFCQGSYSLAPPCSLYHRVFPFIGGSPFTEVRAIVHVHRVSPVGRLPTVHAVVGPRCGTGRGNYPARYRTAVLFRS
jgi:hypothetical protein